jgi:uncharacterized membrane protein
MRMWSRNTTLALAVLCLAAAASLSVAPRPAGAQSFPYTLTVVNRCDRLIYVARRVRDPGGFWITRAWMVIQAGASMRRNLRTYNRVFYLYAFSADRRLTWSGQDKSGSISRPVIQRAFTHTSGPLNGPEMRVVSFARKEIRQGGSSFTQSFSCTNVGGGGSSAEEEGGGQVGGGGEGGGRDPGVGDPGGGPQLGGIPPALAALKGRNAWVLTKTVPATDYCAMLRRLGMTVRCRYEQHASNLNTIILRCPDHDASVAEALKRYLGLTDLKTNNWQRENACGQYHEITIYVNR